MVPTLLVGDFLFVSKFSYGYGSEGTFLGLIPFKGRLGGSEPKRGDIVVFYSPADGVRLVKRVIGVPGDRIGMVNNQLIINGTPLQYDAQGDTAAYSNGVAQELEVERLDGKPHLMLLTPQRPSPRSSFPVEQVPPDFFLMMGDNRDNSNDSRYIGFVPRGEILGRASRVVFSLDPDHWYAPRSGRFLSVLN